MSGERVKFAAGGDLDDFDLLIEQARGEGPSVRRERQRQRGKPGAQSTDLPPAGDVPKLDGVVGGSGSQCAAVGRVGEGENAL